MLTFLSAQTGAMASHFRRELEEIGPKLVILGPGVIVRDRVGERASRQVEIEAEDVARIEALDVVEHASPNVELSDQPVRRGRRTKLLNVVGWDYDAARDPERPRRRGPLPLRPRRGRGRAGRLPRPAREGAPVRRGARARRDDPDRLRALPRDRHRRSRRTTSSWTSDNPDDLMVVIPYTTAQRRFTQTERSAR